MGKQARHAVQLELGHAGPRSLRHPHLARGRRPRIYLHPQKVILDSYADLVQKHANAKVHGVMCVYMQSCVAATRTIYTVTCCKVAHFRSPSSATCTSPLLHPEKTHARHTTLLHSRCLLKPRYPHIRTYSAVATCSAAWPQKPQRILLLEMLWLRLVSPCGPKF